jgi:hypothetical protein
VLFQQLDESTSRFRFGVLRRQAECNMGRSSPIMQHIFLVFIALLIIFHHGVEARKTRLTWVNGIAHNLDHMEEGEKFISKLFAGKPIVYCHNPTAMEHDEDVKGYLFDLTQAGQQKLGVSTAEVDTLVKHLKESVAKVGKNGCVIHIAHSQGALITQLATKHLTKDEMSHIEILAFGGATALRKTEQTPFKRCINYYSVNDPLLMVVPSAAQALRSGLVVADDEFCFLAPRIGDPIRDHHLWGPTYAQALQWEGDRFHQIYVSYAYRMFRFLSLFIIATIKGIMDHFDAIAKFGFRRALLFCAFAYTTTVNFELQLRDVTYSKIIRPISILIVLIMQIVKEKEKYEPVASVLEQDQTL